LPKRKEERPMEKRKIKYSIERMSLTSPRGEGGKDLSASAEGRKSSATADEGKKKKGDREKNTDGCRKRKKKTTHPRGK